MPERLGRAARRGRDKVLVNEQRKPLVLLQGGKMSYFCRLNDPRLGQQTGKFKNSQGKERRGTFDRESKHSPLELGGNLT